MAIEMIKNPSTQADAGDFNLPPCFDQKRYAAKWVQEGAAVTKAQQREALIGLPMTADGWSPYKQKEGAKLCKVATTKGGSYILMYRPREVQDGVNALYGNLGKERMLAEKTGQTVGGVSKQKGMLGEEDLSKERDPVFADDNEGVVQFNKVPGLAQTRIAAEPVPIGASTEETTTD